MISQNELQGIVQYDPRTGTFTRLRTTGNASKKGDILSGPVQIKGKTYQLHRLAFLYMNGSVPNFVKHLDGNKNNNSWSNLAPGVK